MGLGLGSSLSKGGLTTPGIVTDSLVLKHNYAAGGVVPVSDGAALFVASNADYINVGNSSSLQITGTAISVTSWVNILTDTDWMKIISNSTGGSYTDGYTFFYQNEQFHFSINEDTDNVAKVAYTAYGEWHHLTGVYDGTNIKIYVDGVLGGTDTYSSAIGNTRDTYIGAGYTDSINGHMNGNICQLGIWDAALDQEQIQSIMEKTYEELTASEKTNLVSYWALDSTIGDNSTHIIDEHDTTLGIELITGFTNGDGYPVSNFTTSGRDVSGTVSAAFGGVVSNSLTVATGDVYKVTFNLTHTSGNVLRVLISSGATGASASRSDTNLQTTTSGSTTVYLTMTSAGTSYLQLGTGNGGHSIDFSVTDVSCKKVSGNYGVLL